MTLGRKVKHLYWLHGKIKIILKHLRLIRRITIAMCQQTTNLS